MSRRYYRPNKYRRTPSRKKRPTYKPRRKGMRFKDLLKEAGKILNNIWYCFSPFLFFKLFQMILLTGEFSGVTWVIAYYLILVVCYDNND